MTRKPRSWAEELLEVYFSEGRRVGGFARDLVAEMRILPEARVLTA